MTNLLFFDDNPFKGPLHERSIFKYHLSGVMTLDTGGWAFTRTSIQPKQVPKQGMTFDRFLMGINMFIQYRKYVQKGSTIAYNVLACKYIFWKNYKEYLLRVGVTEDQLPKKWEKLGHLVEKVFEGKLTISVQVEELLTLFYETLVN